MSGIIEKTPDNDPDNWSPMDEIGQIADMQNTGVELSHHERVRAFYWFRDKAAEEMRLARLLTDRVGMNMAIQKKHAAVMYLNSAREIFPLTRDGESISILEIVAGKVPADEKCNGS